MIEALAWDSSFFGYPVGQARHRSGSTWDHDGFLKEAQAFSLVYVLTDDPLPTLGSPMDIKVVFERTIDAHEEYPVEQQVLEHTAGLHPDLYQLALESGAYSRFRTDPGFRHQEFQRLYRRWIENAVERSDQLVLVVRDTEHIQGFVSLVPGPEVSTIGLIAVDEKSRGKGLGGALLRACFTRVRQGGGRAIRVVTQEENKGAMALYLRAGFHVTERMHVYHYRPGAGNARGPAKAP